MPLIPFRFAVVGESRLGANRVYIANYNTKCVSFLATSTLPYKLRHILVVRSEPSRAAVAPPSRRRRAAALSRQIVAPLRQCLAYYAGLQSGVCSGRTPVSGHWRLYCKLQSEMRVFICDFDFAL